MKRRCVSNPIKMLGALLVVLCLNVLVKGKLLHYKDVKEVDVQKQIYIVACIKNYSELKFY